MNNALPPNAAGIYKITCAVTKKFYIGSAVNLRRRRNAHFNLLRKNKHKNPYLQRAFNKYGPETFVYEVLELVLPISLTAREQYWFNKLKPFGRKGFNIVRDADRPMLGRKFTPATILKKSLTCMRKRQALKHKHAAETQEETSPARPSRYGKSYIVTAPDGTEYVTRNMNWFCKEHPEIGSRGGLLNVVAGRTSQHKGWKARFEHGEKG